MRPYDNHLSKIDFWIKNLYFLSQIVLFIKINTYIYIYRVGCQANTGSCRPIVHTEIFFQNRFHTQSVFLKEKGGRPKKNDEKIRINLENCFKK